MSTALHKSWPIVPVGDLLKRVRRPVDIQKDATYREIGIRSHCKGIFHKQPTTGAQIGSKRVFWVEPNCLTFNIVFAWEHAVALTRKSEVGMIASHRFPMYTSRNGKLLPEYAWRYFSSARGKYDLQIASPGGAGRNKTLGQEEFMRLKIPLPPVAYQCKTVEALAAIDGAIKAMERLLAAKRKLKIGLAEKLLTGQRRVTQLTKRWSTKRLGDLVAIMSSSVDKKVYAGETEIRLCNYTDVYYNDHITQDLEFTRSTASDSEIEKYSLRRGDVIITKDSEAPGDIAKPAVVTTDMPGTVCGYHLAILRPNNIDSNFLAQLLRLADTRNQLYRIANGVTRFGLSLSALRKLELLIPENVEQRQIAAVLGVADREIAILMEKLWNLWQLKLGLMQTFLSVSQTVDNKAGLSSVLDDTSYSGQVLATDECPVLEDGGASAPDGHSDD